MTEVGDALPGLQRIHLLGQLGVGGGDDAIPVLAELGSWRVLVLVVSGATMIAGGWRALRQHDLKLLLAYGTVSQLGFMMLLFGTGEYKIAQAGVVLLLAHGAFKATLFMLVGIIDREAGSRDIRQLSGLPAASAGATLRAASARGKFQGAMAPTTPTGCLRTRWRLPAA
mgnify:CR=1 FL=1